MLAFQHFKLSGRAAMLVAGGLALSMGSGVARAMITDTVPAGSTAITDRPRAVAAFSLDSPLACSPEARTFIADRLAIWEAEKASAILLAQEMSQFHHAQICILKADLDYDKGVVNGTHGLDEDVRGKSPYSFRRAVDLDFSIGVLLDSVPAIKQGADSHAEAIDKLVEKLRSSGYDHGSFAELGKFKRYEWKYNPFADFFDKLEANARSGEKADVISAQISKNMQKLDRMNKKLIELNNFIIDWLGGKEARLTLDLAILEANKTDPKTFPDLKPKADAWSVVEVADLADDAESEDEDEAVTPAGDSARWFETKAGSADSKAAPPSRKGLDGFYRFVDCSMPPRPVAEGFRVGRGAARIREKVEAQSSELTSTEVVSLVKALEPYGAKCEGNRRKGIMIKLPSGKPGVPFVAKFVHRTHPSKDGFDHHSAEALRQLFDASVFTIDKFR